MSTGPSQGRRCGDAAIEVIMAGSCTLVPLTSAHTDLVLRWRNDPANARWFIDQRTITRDGHEAWLRKQVEAGRDRNWIVQDEEGAFVGLVSLYNVDRDAGEAEFGRLLVAAEHRGRGVGEEATRLALQSAKEAGLRRVYLSVKADNARAISVYRKLGFEAEGEEGGLLSMAHSLG